MHNALDEGKRLVCDVKKHESKNNGNFYKGSTSSSGSTSTKGSEKHKVGTVGKHK